MTLFSQKKSKFLIIPLLTSTNAFCIDMMDQPYSRFSTKYTIPHNIEANARMLLSIKNEAMKAFEPTKTFIKKSTISGARYSKQVNETMKAFEPTKTFIQKSISSGRRYSIQAMGYGLYSAASFLKGSSYLAHMGSVTSLYVGGFLNTVGAIDDLGKIAYSKGYDCASYGVTLLKMNHPEEKSTSSSYLDNILYAPRETLAVSLVLGGGITHGAGICARILGLMTKYTGNLSNHYVSTSLAYLGTNLTIAENSCDDLSQSIFNSLDYMKA